MTTRATLMRVQGAIGARVSSDSPFARLPRSCQTRVLYDRDPKWFPTILCYLRENRLPMLTLSLTEARELPRDAQFYGLDHLCVLVESWPVGVWLVNCLLYWDTASCPERKPWHPGKWSILLMTESISGRCASPC